MKNMFVFFQLLICVTYERTELAEELCSSMDKPDMRLEQVQCCGCFEVALVAAEDFSTVLHSYVLCQDGCRAKLFGAFLTHIFCVIMLGCFVNS